MARVTDIQPGDFDGDGDVDLAVGQFGYDQGEIRWMENQGELRFESHQLLSLPGTIHVPVADMDGDGCGFEKLSSSTSFSRWRHLERRASRRSRRIGKVCSTS